MRTRRPTLERLLHSDGTPQEAVRLIALTARNLMEVSARKEGARVLPPVGGEPAGEAFRDFFDDLRTVGLSSIGQRQKLGPHDVFAPGPGRQIVLADRLTDVAHLMRHAQCKLAGSGQRAWALTDAYVRREGGFQDRSGVDRVRLGRMRSTPAPKRSEGDDERVPANDPLAPYRFLWSKAFIRTALAAALPPIILDLKTVAQVSHMRGLRAQIEELWSRHADDYFPFEIFSLIYDFSLHESNDIVTTLQALRPDIREPAGRRAAKLAQPMHALLTELADLFEPGTRHVRARFVIHEGLPLLTTRMIRQR